MLSVLSAIVLISMLVCTKSLYIPKQSTTQSYKSNVGQLVMKGKKIPIQYRGELMKQKRMMELKNQMEKDKPEGVPIFKLFVRPKVGGFWIPCGDLAGDKKATALVNGLMSGFLTDTYRNQLDQGIARSVFNQEDTFVKNLIANYRPFKNYGKDDLMFGYTIEFEGLFEKLGQQSVRTIEKGMEKSWIDNVKEGFGNLFN